MTQIMTQLPMAIASVVLLTFLSPFVQLFNVNRKKQLIKGKLQDLQTVIELQKTLDIAGYEEEKPTYEAVFKTLAIDSGYINDIECVETLPSLHMNIMKSFPTWGITFTFLLIVMEHEKTLFIGWDYFLTFGIAVALSIYSSKNLIESRKKMSIFLRVPAQLILSLVCILPAILFVAM